MDQFYDRQMLSILHIQLNKFILRMNSKMLSQAGRMHQKCKRIKPLSKNQRQKVYASCQMSYEARRGASQKKYSPFNTVPRTSRNSYLLRVTVEPNTQTNYDLNFASVIPRLRRSTIDQAGFQRIIGPVNLNDYSVQPSTQRDHRCEESFKQTTAPKPMTARQIQKWRKTHQHIDFTKQINPQRNNPHDYLKQMKNSDDNFEMKTLRQTTQSNFNNYKRFSLTTHTEKSHNFNSDSGHKYLDKIYSREIEPQYDILTNKEEIIRKSMKKPKGELRFNLFKNQIKTKIDRADPNWLQTLDYTPQIDKQQKKNTTIDFNLTTNRFVNEVYSKYPIRQSLKNYVPHNTIK